MTYSVNELQFVEVTLVVHSKLADAVGNYISENITDGIEFLDLPDPELVSIRFYVPDSDSDFRDDLSEYLKEVAVLNKLETPKYSERMIASKDWEETYKRSIEPVHIDEVIVVRPPWVEPSGKVEYDIVIEPKMAFGTGHHETTRACLHLLHKYFKKGQSVLDFGCGTGVLAMLAAKMGASYAKAVDYDAVCIESTEENFELNNIETINEIVLGSFEKVVGDDSYDMVCANLRKSDLVENFELLVELTKEDGCLMLSGLLEQDQNEIETCINQARLNIIEFIHDGEWLTYLVKR